MANTGTNIKHWSGKSSEAFGGAWAQIYNRTLHQPLDLSQVYPKLTYLYDDLNDNGSTANLYKGQLLVVTSDDWTNNTFGNGNVNTSKNVNHTYSPFDDKTGRTGPYLIYGYTTNGTSKNGSYYADRILTYTELQAHYVRKYDLGSYYTGVGEWYQLTRSEIDADKSLAKKYRDSVETFNDADAKLMSYAEIFNDYVDNIATGSYSHAEGFKTKTTAYGAHAEGIKTEATGIGSHAEGGSLTYTNGVASNLVAGGKASGNASHAEGELTLAIGEASHAEGALAYSYGQNSHTEGNQTYAVGVAAHAEGLLSYAYANFSHAEGWNAYVTGIAAHAEGIKSYAFGQASHAEGVETIAHGDGSHVEGGNIGWNVYITGTKGSKTAILRRGGVNGTLMDYDFWMTKDYLKYSLGMLEVNAQNTQYIDTCHNKIISAVPDYTNKYYNITFENPLDKNLSNTHFFILLSASIGSDSHSESSLSVGQWSHAEGELTVAHGTASHSEGRNTYAGSDYSHAEGQYTVAHGLGSHSEGSSTYAFGNYSHSGGIQSYANGDYSFAHGSYTISELANETAIGKYNGWTVQAQTTGHTINTANHSYTDMLFEVGDGTSHTARHDAFAVGSNGNTYVFGNLFVDGKIASVDQTPTFTNASINNYVTYTNGNQITSNNVKFISDVSINSAGALTYNQGKITYATGAVGGTANKGIISVNTATTKGVSATTKLGLTISDGIIKFTKIIDPIICLTGSTTLRPTATSQNITISVNNYTVSTPIVNYSITPSWSTASAGQYNDLTAAADTAPTKSFTVPIAWSAPYKDHTKTITWTAPTVTQMGGTAKTVTITISDPVPAATRTANDDDTKIGNSYTIYIRYPIFYATSDVFNVSANNATTQNLSTVCGWCTGDGAMTGLSAFTGGANEGYVAIYSTSATKLVKYLWGTTANTSASRIRTITLFGVTYSVYKLSGSSANKLTITALS